jgi:small subunit ribosomal protein S4
MARYTGPKNRISRREGVNLGLKSGLGVKLERRLKVVPGQHGRRGKKKTSEYGLQLREKQKLKAIYGVLEKQFRKYFSMAKKTKSATGATLLEILERRLDNAVYRLGFANTRAAARQAVSHSHVYINGKKNNIPSTIICKDDVISIDNKWMNNPDVKKMLEDKSIILPDWLERKAAVGKVVKLPIRGELDLDVNEQLIVEFYSR